MTSTLCQNAPRTAASILYNLFKTSSQGGVLGLTDSAAARCFGYLQLSGLVHVVQHRALLLEAMHTVGMRRARERSS